MNTESTQKAPSALRLPKRVAVGDKFGRLTVTERINNDSAGRIRLRCTCECGSECAARLSDLRTGHTKSCGCLREISRSRRFPRIFLRQFGTLFALGKAEEVHETRASTKWVTICKICLKVVIATSSQLRSGKRKCRCLDATYGSWRNMVQRCTNENHTQYKDYGGRGIRICDEWRSNFQQFAMDMGRRPAGQTLDRRDAN